MYARVYLSQCKNSSTTMKPNKNAPLSLKHIWFPFTITDEIMVANSLCALRVPSFHHLVFLHLRDASILNWFAFAFGCSMELNKNWIALHVLPMQFIKTQATIILFAVKLMMLDGKYLYLWAKHHLDGRALARSLHRETTRWCCAAQWN